MPNKSYILIKGATNCEPTESSALDDKKQPFSVRQLGNTKEFYITEYACASDTGWYAFVPNNNDISKDGYEKIIKINDICVLEGAKILYIRESSLNSLDEHTIEMLYENTKKACVTCK